MAKAIVVDQRQSVGIKVRELEPGDWFTDSSGQIFVFLNNEPSPLADFVHVVDVSGRRGTFLKNSVVTPVEVTITVRNLAQD